MTKLLNTIFSLISMIVHDHFSVSKHRPLQRLCLADLFDEMARVPGTVMLLDALASAPRRFANLEQSKPPNIMKNMVVQYINIYIISIFICIYIYVCVCGVIFFCVVFMILDEFRVYVHTPAGGLG